MRTVGTSGASSSTSDAALSIVQSFGQVFDDGALIELVRNGRGGVDLMLCEKGSEISGARVTRCGTAYEPAPIDRSLLSHLVLPRTCIRHSSTRKLFEDLCKLLADLVDLDERAAGLAARLILCSAMIDAFPIAPALAITGSDAMRADRLMKLLRCLCRRALLLTGVTPERLYSLPSGARFTLLISQSTISERLLKTLDDISCGESKVVVRGRLVDLFGFQVLRCDSSSLQTPTGPRTVEIALNPSGKTLPLFDTDVQQRTTDEFQSRLLGFRRANLSAASRVQFDASRLDLSLQGLAATLAASTPDEPGLQLEVLELLRDVDAERRSERWTDLRSVACAALLVKYAESPGEIAYVKDLAKIAQTILSRRGAERSEVCPAVLGKVFKTLGIKTEPRDAKGVKVLLNDTLAESARVLIREFGGPEVSKAEEAPQNSRATPNFASPGLGL